MNRLFESALARTNFDSEGGVGPWTPVADVYETPESVHVLLELPGVAPSEVDVRVEGEEMVISGEVRMDRPGDQFHRVERTYGRFSRRFPLPSGIDRGSVRASFRQGVLFVEMARRGDEESRTIRVSVG